MAKSLFDEEKKEKYAREKEEKILKIQQMSQQKENEGQEETPVLDNLAPQQEENTDVQQSENTEDGTGQLTGENQVDNNDNSVSPEAEFTDFPKSENKQNVKNSVDGNNSSKGDDCPLVFDSSKVYGLKSPDAVREYLPAGTILPTGTVIIHDGVTYTIKEKLGQGGFAITYRAEFGNNELVVIKEFHPRHSIRYTDYTLCYDLCDEQDITYGKDKFKKEPERIYTILEEGKGKSTRVNDQMTYSEAWEIARDELDAGGVFTYRGKVYTTYNNTEKQELNIAMPKSKHFNIGSGLYFIMEYVPGNTLEKFLHEKGVKFDLAMKIMKQLCLAVKNIHNIPCAHMDITPSNIIFSQNSEGDVNLKIIDFGLATSTKGIDVDTAGKRLSEKRTRGSFVRAGTEHFTDAILRYNSYLAEDELNLGKKIQLIDIYSLGCILCYMTLVGRRQDSDDTNSALASKIAEMHSQGMKDKLPSYLKANKNDSALELKQKRFLQACYELVRKATAYDFAERIKNVDEFLIGLQYIQAEIVWDNEEEIKIMPAEGGKVYLHFHYNFRCAVHLTSDWIKLLGKNLIRVPGSEALLKDKIQGGIELLVEPNDDTRTRTASVIIVCGKSQLVATINQEGKTVVKPEITIPEDTRTSLQINAEGGKDVIEFKATALWTVTMENNQEDWLEVSKKSGKAGTQSIVLEAGPNDTYRERTAIIKIACGDKEVVWSVEQKPKKYTPIRFINNEEPFKDMPAGGGIVSIGLEADEDWFTHFLSPELRHWIECKQSGGAGTQIIEIKVAPNETTTRREAQIEFKLKHGVYSVIYTISQEKAVIQEVKEEVIIPEIIRPDLIFPKSVEYRSQIDVVGGKDIIEFKATAPWTVTIVNNQENWLNVSKKSGEAGSQSIVLEAGPNDIYKDRTATVKIVCGDKTVNWSVEQKTKNHSPIRLNRDNFANKIMPAEGGVATIVFTADKAWSVHHGSPDNLKWVVCKQSGEAGIQIIEIKVTPNKTTVPREAQIEFKCGEHSVISTVKQEKGVQVDVPVNTPKTGSSEDKKEPGKTIITGNEPKKADNRYKRYIVGAVLACLVAIGGWMAVDKPWENETPGYYESDKNEEISSKIDVLKLVKDQHYEINYKGGSQAIELESPGVWKATVAEQSPEGWLNIQEGSGKAGKGKFGIVAKQNLKYEPKKATIEITSGSQRILAHITQGIDRADSLNNVMISTIQTPIDIVKFLKKMHPVTQVLECYEEGGEEYSIDVDVATILSKKNPDVIIGKTHDIIEFEQTEDGRINKLVLLKK